MDFRSLQDFKNIKALFQNIAESVSVEARKLKDVNQDVLVKAFNKYFFSYSVDNYVNFEGRTSRRQCWMFLLFYFVITALLFLLGKVFEPFLFVLFIFGAVLVLPLIGVCVRRLHDINVSGWWVLVILIPYVSYILLLVLAFPGDKDDNNYGAPVK